MNHSPSFSSSSEAGLLVCYIVLLLILMIRLEVARSRPQVSLDFEDLLDKLENVGAEGRSVYTSASSWKTRATKEMLRRMAGNALIFSDLVRMPGLEAPSLDHRFIREVHGQSVRLRSCAHLLRLAQSLPLHFLNVPGSYLLNYVVTTYWSVVYRTLTSCSFHESSRRCTALRTACNLAV